MKLAVLFALICLIVKVKSGYVEIPTTYVNGRGKRNAHDECSTKDQYLKLLHEQQENNEKWLRIVKMFDRFTKYKDDSLKNEKEYLLKIEELVIKVSSLTSENEKLRNQIEAKENEKSFANSVLTKISALSQEIHNIDVISQAVMKSNLLNCKLEMEMLSKSVLERNAQLDECKRNYNTSIWHKDIEIENKSTEIPQLKADLDSEKSKYELLQTNQTIYRNNSNQAEPCPDKKYTNNSKALYEATKEGRTKTVKALLVNCEDPNGTWDGHWSALYEASLRGHTDIVTILINYGADVHSKTSLGYPSLVIAAERGHTDIVRILLDRGAKVNYQYNGNGSAIIRASWFGQVEVIKMLIAAGADVNAKDGLGWTSLNHASYFENLENKEEIVAMLKAAGAKE